VIYDRFPVTELHALVIPKRHAPTYLDLYEQERRAINMLLDELARTVRERDKSVAGFNIGMNCGEVAGQTENGRCAGTPWWSSGRHPRQGELLNRDHDQLRTRSTFALCPRPCKWILSGHGWFLPSGTALPKEEQQEQAL
jgi:hypothetical protein